MVEAVFPGKTYDEGHSRIRYYNKSNRVVYCKLPYGNMVPFEDIPPDEENKEYICPVPVIPTDLKYDDLTGLLAIKDKFSIREVNKANKRFRAIVGFADAGWKYVVIQEHFEKQKPAKKKGALT